jgi:hypothetical protein
MIDFDSNNVVINKHIFGIHKIHQGINNFQHGQNTRQAKIVSMSPKFNKSALVDSREL